MQQRVIPTMKTIHKSVVHFTCIVLVLSHSGKSHNQLRFKSLLSCHAYNSRKCEIILQSRTLPCAIVRNSSSEKGSIISLHLTLKSTESNCFKFPELKELCMYVCVCVCGCVCAWVALGGGWLGNTTYFCTIYLYYLIYFIQFICNSNTIISI